MYLSPTSSCYCPALWCWSWDCEATCPLYQLASTKGGSRKKQAGRRRNQPLPFSLFITISVVSAIALYSSSSWPELLFSIVWFSQCKFCCTLRGTSLRRTAVQRPFSSQWGISTHWGPPLLRGSGLSFMGYFLWAPGTWET